MNEETQEKILVLLGTGMTISDYLEDLKDELPLLVRREHKKAFNDMIRSTKSYTIDCFSEWINKVKSNWRSNFIILMLALRVG